MEYWNRIDLHQHTDHDIDCKGRKVDNNYSHVDYYKWLEEEKVKLKAVTCHNNIDIVSHIKHAIISDLLDIKHLVGVEIDYKFEELEFHAITILSPNVDVISFANKLAEIRNKKGNEIYLNREDFCNLHSNIEFIFIPHAIKDKGILEQKIGHLESSTIDWVIKSLISGVGEPILFENTKDYHIYSVYDKISNTLNLKNVEIEIAAYIGDDYRFDNDEQRREKIRNKTKYAINSCATYRGLEIALRNSVSRLSIEDQVINRERFIKSIIIPKNDVFEGTELHFSPGLNVIIGNSGSGKTLLLNEIYYELEGKNLKAAQKDNKDSKENQYKSKIGNKNILNINFDQKIEKPLVLLEIPNIYSEILKFQNNDTHVISKMFGIDDSTNSSVIVSNYKTIINEFLSELNSEKISTNNGKQNLINIKSAIDFLCKNKTDIKSFNLNGSIFEESKLKSISNKIDELNRYISDSEKIIEYFIKIKKIISNIQGKKAIESILENYRVVIDSLKKENIIYNREYNNLMIEKIISDKINRSISKSVNLLGNREKSLKEREQVLAKEKISLISNIKDSIIRQLKCRSYDLSFPYLKLKKELEKNNNEYARLTLNLTDEEIRETNILSSKIFSSKNIKLKLKELSNTNFNLTNSDEVKKVVMELNNIEIRFSDILFDDSDIPRNVELFLSDKDEWRFIENINKGDIAKKSLEYYFNRLIKENQPDIILIDQPENDVDKTFISTTLSSFIKAQKIDKQIIVTSHDAIIAINSDANKIIEANVTDDNKIKYESYDIEEVDGKILSGTNKVARILDGGKNNIKRRYQIYGGELNYENRNL